MRTLWVKLLSICLVLALSTQTAAAQGVSLIRDAEIERGIRGYARPLWRVAGLDPDAVQVHIVNDQTLNAFVAGGQRIFVNTGLLIDVETPNQLIGVLAHETGHITGGHLARTQDAIKDASSIAILSMLLGAAAIAAGGGDAGAALIASSSGFATRNFLAYSRTQESAADQAGLTFLEETGQSGRGLIDFLEHLGDQEALLSSSQDPYVRSHPLTRERVARLRQAAQASAHWDAKDSPESIQKLRRMQAKILGYMEPKRALQKYPADDPSVEARYARAFALYRESLTKEALALVDSLIAERPDDPFFYELKGQILFESGHAGEAIEPLSKSVAILPDESLLHILYAQALLSTERKEDAKAAADSLTIATRHEKQNPTVWHLLAQAYHVTGNQPMSDLAAAEEHVLTGRVRQAVFLAKRASKSLEEGTPSWWRAQDIVFIAESNGALDDDK